MIMSKRLLSILLFLIGIVQGTIAQEKEPYAVLSDDGKTVTFYYDTQKASRSGVVEINNSHVDTWKGESNAYGTAVEAHFDASFAAYRPTSTAYWFDECRQLVSITDMENLKTENVTDMGYMFCACSSLMSLDLGNFNTANVTDMTALFCLCTNLKTVNLSSFNTVNVKNMYYMFSDCSSLTSLDLSNFNTVNVTNMGRMFCACSSLASLDLSSFNTANVTDMSFMFTNCYSLASLNVSNFNTANVTSMCNMFTCCYSLTSLDLSHFNTANVTSMSDMFGVCRSLKNLDVSGFNTANVTNIGYMFRACSSLETIYADESKWSTVSVTNGNDMFNGCTSLEGGNGTMYDASHVDIEYARIDKEGQPGYFSVVGAPKPPIPRAYAVLSDEGKTVTFYYDMQKASRSGVVINYEAYGSTITTAVFDASFADYRPTSTAYWFYKCTNLTSITGINHLNTDNVTNMSCMFDDCSSLTSLDVSGFKTDNVTDMRYMFDGCSGLTSLDLSNFNTSNVTDMSGMFSWCPSLTTLDVSNFNTANVTDMSGMFSVCSGLTTLDVSNFNTANVTDMGGMFAGCRSLTSLDVSGFNTANVTDMGSMFSGCSSLTTLDLSNFNTGNVTNMNCMFVSCSSLTTLDLSSFNTEKVTSMEEMFECSSLTTIYCNDAWSVTNAYMFYDCTNLKGDDGTAWSSSAIDVSYAHPNAGGYFTKKGLETTYVAERNSYWRSYYTETRNVKADENTTVYVATLSGDQIVLTEIEDKIVPAGQAVVLKSTVSRPVLYTAGSEGTGDYSGNALRGTQRDLPVSEVSGTVYTLANGSSGLGFYKFNGTTLKGERGYLAVDGAAARSFFSVDDTTGISLPAADDKPETMYDLQGRRVEKTGKGIYIVNGKKIAKP